MNATDTVRNTLDLCECPTWAVESAKAYAALADLEALVQAAEALLDDMEDGPPPNQRSEGHRRLAGSTDERLGRDRECQRGRLDKADRGVAGGSEAVARRGVAPGAVTVLGRL